MKKLVLFTVAETLLACLLSFATKSEESQEIIRIAPDMTVEILQAEKISMADYQILGQFVLGWTFCDKQSLLNQCNEKAYDFPDEAMAQQQVMYVINKYQHSD